MKDQNSSTIDEVEKVDMDSPSRYSSVCQTKSRHLRFNFKTDPFWRSSPIDPNSMIRDIRQFLIWFRNLSDQQQKQIETSGIPTTFRDFYVFKMNTEEREGTQSLGETKFVGRSPKKFSFSNVQQITYNIFRALDLTKGLAQVAEEDQNGTYFITVQSINAWHKQVWEDVKDESGVRDVRPGTPRREEFGKELVAMHVVPGIGALFRHMYPKSATVPEGFQIFVDRFNEMAETIRNNSSAGSEERLRESIKWAAWALFYCLSLHPYADGNGRTSRLLCNYVLSSVFPFEVPVFNVHSRTSRHDYIKALETVSRCPCLYPKDDGRTECWTYSEVFGNSDPSLIATLVLESCWATCYAFWKRASKKIPSILSDFPLDWSLDSPGIMLAARSLSLNNQPESFDDELDGTEEEMDPDTAA